MINNFDNDLTPPDVQQSYDVFNTIISITTGWTLAHKLIFYPNLLKAQIGNLDLKSPDSDGNTPLHLAVLNLDNLSLETLQLLLIYGSDPLAFNREGYSSLQLICDQYEKLSKNKGILDYLPLLINNLPPYVGNEKLIHIFKCISKVDFPIQIMASFLQRYIFDLNRIDTRRPLFWCVYDPQKEDRSLIYLKYLLQYDINLNLMGEYEDNNYLTLLMYSNVEHTTKISQFLIQHCNINIRKDDDCNYSALDYAIIHNQEAIIETLLEFKVDLKSTNRKEGTPLQTAISRHYDDNCSLEIIKLLIEGGAEHEGIIPSQHSIWQKLFLHTLDVTKSKKRKISEIKIV